MKIAISNLLAHANRDRNAVEVEEELQFHIEMLECKFAKHGMSTAEAKAAARRRFGNLERVRRQCVNISRRNGLLRRLLKTSSIVVALIGLAIHVTSTDYKVARIGQVLIMIAILGRLLIYVRGLGSSAFLPKNKEPSLSVIPETPEN